MYQVGDMVVYGSEGVCRVISVGTPETGGANKGKQYYTLEPLYCAGRIFAPVDTPVHIRPVMTREEAENLIRIMPDIEPPPPPQLKNPRMLSDHYKQMMRTCDRLDIIRLIKQIHEKQTAILARGGKASQVDERFMKRAEDLLYGELSVSLEIPMENVKAYIAQTLDGLQQTG
jgi:CarD family transcriptional regulator